MKNNVKNLQDIRERLVELYGNDPEFKADLHEIVRLIDARIRDYRAFGPNMDELNQKAINDYKASQIDYRKQSGCENKQMLEPGIALYGGSIVHLSR